MSRPKLTLTDVRRTETAIYLTTRDNDDGSVQTVSFGVDGNKEGLPYELVRASHSVDFADDEGIDLTLVAQDGKGDARLLVVWVEDTKRLLPMLQKPRQDDMPVLMSGPNVAAPKLAAVELGEDAITLELHYPASKVGILKLGFRGCPNPYRYQLVETGYTTGAVGDVPMFGFVAECEDGKRYRWYVHTENPAELYLQINAHMAAKPSPKSDDAA